MHSYTYRVQKYIEKQKCVPNITVINNLWNNRCYIEINTTETMGFTNRLGTIIHNIKTEQLFDKNKYLSWYIYIASCVLSL